MPLGILEDHSTLAHVPGTVLLAEQNANSEDITGLKHGTGRSKGIVLVPQPSEDPNDPLNWPYLKKLAIVAILVFGASLCGATVAPLLNASLYVLAIDFDRPLSDLTVTSGYQLLIAGCSGPIISALSSKYGKRPTFLLSSFICLIGSIVGSASTTYSTLLAARIIQGLSIPAYESLVFSVIGDIFFVHERGLFIAIMGFTLGSVANLSSVIAGRITNSLGWHYLFYLLVLFISLQLLLCFLFVPETTYSRDIRYETDETVEISLEELAEIEARHQAVIDGKEIEKTMTNNTWTGPPPKKTFWQEKAIFTGSHGHENLIKLLVAPIISFTNLGACWVIVIMGGTTSFFVAESLVSAQIFSPPPYSLTTASVGYMSIGPFLGGLVGSIVLGFITDPLAIWLTNLNKGVFEPEFRLVPSLLGVFTGAGLMGFGAVTSHGGNLYLADFLWGMSLAGVIFTVTPASSYAVDAYRDMSSEVFIASMMFKNFLFYSYTYFLNDWTASVGPAIPFYTFGGVSFGIVATTIVMYVFGKRYRRYWHDHNIFHKLGIQTHAEL